LQHFALDRRSMVCGDGEANHTVKGIEKENGERMLSDATVKRILWRLWLVVALWLCRS